jgi:hypothetical protein
LGHEPSKPAALKPAGEHKPFVPADQDIPEFTLKAILFGSLFGIIFGASTVYLALKAGLTVSASIPIAVLSISVLRLFGRATILENNIVQTIGSAGESVAAGVAFTIPALLFLSPGAKGQEYFDYVQIMTLAACGGILGVLFMVPLRRSLIVAEHGNLPYPEGTACADVLIAGEKGGRMAGLVFGGVGLSVAYKALNSIFAFWKEAVTFATSATAKLPNARVSSEISPEYLGVGYILGPRIGGIMVSGSVVRVGHRSACPRGPGPWAALSVGLSRPARPKSKPRGGQPLVFGALSGWPRRVFFSSRQGVARPASPGRGGTPDLLGDVSLRSRARAVPGRGRAVAARCPGRGGRGSCARPGRR